MSRGMVYVMPRAIVSSSSSSSGGGGGSYESFITKMPSVGRSLHQPTAIPLRRFLDARTRAKLD